MIKNYFSGGLDKDLNSEFLKNLKFNKRSESDSFESCALKVGRSKIYLRRKKIREKIQINMIPLIDVLLVLLIVFMITAETINSNVDINLPEAKNKSSKEIDDLKKNEIVIFVDSKGEISLNERKFLNLEEFENFLYSKMTLKFGAENSEFSPEKEIILSSDKDVSYQKIIEILVLLNNNGLNKIKMAYKNT